MNIIKTALLTLGALSMFTSCDSDDPEAMTAFALRDTLSYVYDTNTSSEELLDGATYVLTFNLTDQLLTVAVNDLKLKGNSGSISFTLENIPYKTSTNVNEATLSMTQAGNHTISNFRFVQRGLYIPIFNEIVANYEISFVVDGNYVVQMVQDEVALGGTTTITDKDGVSSNTANAAYTYDLDLDTKTADVSAYKLTLGDITYQEISFDNVPFTVDNKGIHILAVEPFKAEAEQYSKETLMDCQSLRFDAAFNSASTFTTTVGDFTISANLSSNPQKTTTE